MRTKFKKCPSCGRYTLKDKCESCSVETKSPLPARFSPADKYGKYRRLLKKSI